MSTVYSKCLQILNQKNEKLIPENLKKDITIYDVTGTLETLDTSDATASASDIIQDKTAYMRGEKFTGTLSDRRSTWTNQLVARSQSIVAGDSIINISFNGPEEDQVIGRNTRIDGLIYSSDFSQKAGITPEVIKKGTKILNITGTYEGLDTSDATATASDIVQGKTAYISNNKITGTIKNTSYKDEFEINNIGLTEINHNIVLMYELVPDNDLVIRSSNDACYVYAKELVVADAVGLTADKLKKDEEILGITGTYEGEGNYQIKTITNNGEYTPDVGYDAFSKVTVNVSSGSGHDSLRQYSSEEEMRADIENTEPNDKAMIYKTENRAATKNDTFNKIIFKDEFTIDITDIEDGTYGTWLIPADPEIEHDDMNRFSLYINRARSVANADIDIMLYIVGVNLQISYTGTFINSNTVKFTVDDYYEDLVGEHDLVIDCKLTNDIEHDSTPDKPFHPALFEMFDLPSGKLDGLWIYDKVTDINKIGLFSTQNISVSSEGVISIIDDKVESILKSDLTSCMTAAKNRNSNYTTIFKINGEYYTGYLQRVIASNGSTYYHRPNLIYYNNRYYLGYTRSATMSSATLYLTKLDIQNGTLIGSVITKPGTLITVAGTTNGDVIFDVNIETVPVIVDSAKTDYIYCANSNHTYYNLRNVYGYTYQWCNLPTQLNCNNPNQLLEGYTVLGSSGIITGDGSIYDNLDKSRVQPELFGLSPFTILENARGEGFDNTHGPITLYGPENQLCVTNYDSTNKLTFAKEDLNGDIIIGKYTLATKSLPNWFVNGYGDSGMCKNNMFYELIQDSSALTSIIKIGTSTELKYTSSAYEYYRYSSTGRTVQIISPNINNKFYYKAYDTSNNTFKVIRVDLDDFTEEVLYSFTYNGYSSGSTEYRGCYVESVNDQYLCVMFGQATSSSQIRKIGKIYDIATSTNYDVFDITQSAGNLNYDDGTRYRMCFQTINAIYFGPAFYSNHTYLYRFDKTTKAITTTLNNCTSIATPYGYMTDGRYSIAIENDTYIYFEGYATSITINKSSKTITTQSAGSAYNLYNYNLHIGKDGTTVWGMDRSQTTFYELEINGLNITVKRTFSNIYCFAYYPYQSSNSFLLGIETPLMENNTNLIKTSSGYKVTTPYLDNEMEMKFLRASDCNDYDYLFTEGNPLTVSQVHNLAILKE